MDVFMAVRAEPSQILAHVIASLSTADLVMQLRSRPALAQLTRLIDELQMQARYERKINNALFGAWVRASGHSSGRYSAQKAQNPLSAHP